MTFRSAFIGQLLVQRTLNTSEPLSSPPVKESIFSKSLQRFFVDNTQNIVFISIKYYTNIVGFFFFSGPEALWYSHEKKNYLFYDRLNKDKQEQMI